MALVLLKLSEVLVDFLFGDNNGSISNPVLHFFILSAYLILSLTALFFLIKNNKITINFLFYIRNIGVLYYKKANTLLVTKKKYWLLFTLLIVTISCELLLNYFLGNIKGLREYPFFSFVYLVLFVSGLYNLFKTTPFFSHIFYNRNLLLSVSIIIVPFFISRAIFYCFFNYMYFTNDSPGYFSMVEQMNHGLFPNTEYRTLGYPLFLKLCYSIYNNNISVMLGQSLLTVCSALFFIYCLFKIFNTRTVYFSIALSIFLCSYDVMCLETTYQTESVYINSLFVCLSFLLLSIKYKNNLYFILLSVSIWVVMIVRPAGLFLIPVLLLISLFFLVNKYAFKNIAALILPFVILYFSICFYNKNKCGEFKFTTFGAFVISGAAMTYLERDEAYPEYINNHISRFKDSVLQKDINTVKNTWDLPRIQCTYSKEYNNVWTFREELLKDSVFISASKNNPSALTTLFSKIASNSIKRHPDLAFKYFISGIYPYFFENKCTYNNDFYYELLRRHQVICIDKVIIPYIQTDEKLKQNLYKEYYDTKSSASIVQVQKNKFVVSKNGYSFVPIIKMDNGKDVIYIKNKIIEADAIVRYAFSRLLFFNNAYFWTISLLTCFVLSLRRLIKDRFTNPDILIPFIFCLIPLLQGALVCSFNYNDVRHSITNEFLKYFSGLFLFIYLFNKSADSASKY